MKRFACFLTILAIMLVLLAVPSWAQGPCSNGNCSIAAMTLTKATQDCQEPTVPLPLEAYSAGGTTTYEDTALAPSIMAKRLPRLCL